MVSVTLRVDAMEWWLSAARETEAYTQNHQVPFESVHAPSPMAWRFLYH